MKVLIDSPPWFIRPENTDWRYMQGLACLETYINVEIVMARSQIDAARESLAYLKARLGGRVERLSRNAMELKEQAANCDVVISHRRYPLSLPIPVVWQYAVLDPEMQAASGRADEEIESQYVEQSKIYDLAAKIQVSTEAEAIRHANKVPSVKSKFAPVPFFLPRVVPVSLQELRGKHESDNVVRVLFVGREAWRKGLDLVIAALKYAPAISKKVELTIVSECSDKKIELSQCQNMKYFKRLPHADIIDLMRKAHVFVMPSRFESFGFTLIEAMAAGCAIVGPNWEVQREILNNGSAGVCVAPVLNEVLAALERVVMDRSYRTCLALEARERYQERFEPTVVAKKYSEMLQSAVAQRV